MRHAVMLLFVVPQAVSLLLCCCTLGAKPAPLESAARPATVACELCCHQLPPVDPNHDQLGRPSPGCPCRQMMVSLLLGTPGTLEPATTPEPAGDVPSFAVESPKPTIAPNLAPARMGETSFHPPDHRQRYHRVLRC